MDLKQCNRELGLQPDDVLVFQRGDGRTEVKVAVWRKDSSEAEAFVKALMKT